MSESKFIKIREYCEFYEKNRPEKDYPSGVLDVASKAVRGNDLRLLRAIAKELDIRVRDLLTPKEQEALICSMITAGVAMDDLPKTVTLRRINSLLRRGELRSQEEFDCARSFFDSPAVSQLGASERVKLGRLMDTFQLNG